MENTPKKTRRALSVEEKRIMIDLKEQGYTNKYICDKFGRAKSIISDVLRNQKEKVLENNNLKQLRSKPVMDSRLDEALKLYVNDTRQKHLPVLGNDIRAKALIYSRKLGMSPSFKASDGWFTKFKKRHDLKHNKKCGDNSFVNQSVVTEFQANLPALLHQYHPDDIYNFDEFALFYRAMPDKKYAFKNDKCTDGKFCNERITVFPGVNMSGTDKRQLLVIGRFKNPRCFEGIKSLPVIYHNNNSAWMTGKIFEDYFKTFDDECREKNRFVQVWVDNCAAHPKRVNNILTNIKLCYLPPNVKSVSQPCDQGIIKVLKSHFRFGLVKLKINAAKKNNESQEFSVLDSIKMLAMIWETKLSQQAISNCFRKAGFLHKDQHNNNSENENQHDTGDIEFDCNNYFEEMKSDGFLNFQDFSTFDDNVMTNSNLTDDNIIELVTMEQDSHVCSNDYASSGFSSLTNLPLISDDIDIIIEPVTKEPETITPRVIHFNEFRLLDEKYKSLKLKYNKKIKKIRIMKQQIASFIHTIDNTFLNDEESSADDYEDMFETSDALTPADSIELPMEFVELPSSVTVKTELDNFHSGYFNTYEQIQMKEENIDDTS